MSVYYNITKFNKDKEPQRFVVNETSFDAVLPNQSLYEVGVKRFKIPATEIDLFRIYPNRYVIGSTIISSGTNGTTKFFISDLFNSKSVMSLDFDADENSFYIPITSHKHFAQLLTRTLYNTINDSLDALEASAFTPITNGNLTLRGTSKQTGVFNGNTGGLTNDGLQPLTWTSAPTKLSASTTVPSDTANNMRRVVSWELDIASLSLVDSANDSDMDDLIFTVFNEHIEEINNSGTQPTMRKVGCAVLKGLCKGKKISDFSTIFPNGLKVSSYGTLKQNGRTDYPNDIQPNLMCSDDCDFNGIMGTLGEFSTWTIGVSSRNDSYGSNNAPPALTLKATLQIYNSNAGTFTKSGEISSGANGGALTNQFNSNLNQSLPFFDVSPSDNKLQFNTLYSYLQSGLNIYVNDGLRNIIGFDTQKLPNIPLNEFKFESGSVQNSGLDLNLNGAVLQFNIPNTISGDLFDSKHITCIEPEISVFKRNFVYGLAITANSFSIDGEYEGNGSATRKILSDFEIDPSTNFRDYYIYQPSGDSVRYYQMKSSSGLRDIFVSVFYRDMNGHYKQLEIGQGYLGSIKIHFRPVKNIN